MQVLYFNLAVRVDINVHKKVHGAETTRVNILFYRTHFPENPNFCTFCLQYTPYNKCTDYYILYIYYGVLLRVFYSYIYMCGKKGNIRIFVSLIVGKYDHIFR